MAKANNTRIEETATTALKSSLIRCPILMPYIESNDKTPSWDGTVFVYKNGDQKKTDFLGRVPVQVKGTEKEQNGGNASYSCSLVDLRNYYKDGGCIFFLIQVNPDTGVSKIYYLSLQVFDLKKLLDKSNGQKSLTIKLSPFPTEDINEIEAIFLGFVDNYKKQGSFIGKELLTLEQLEKQGVEIDTLTFSTSGVGLNRANISNFITTHDFYLYAKQKGLDLEIPVEKISNAVVSMPVNGSVIVNNTEYFSSYSVVTEKGKSRIQIGKSIRISIDEVAHKMTFSFRPSGTLSDYINDGECFAAIAEYKSISLNGAFFTLDGVVEIDVERFKQGLQYYKDVKRTLELLGVDEDLQCDKLSSKDETNLQNFVNAILYNKKIGFPGTEGANIHGAFKIANLSIWIWATQEENGFYCLENFFSPHSIAMFEDTDILFAHPVPASQYLLLNKDAFAHTSNMDYDAVMDDIGSMKQHPLLVDSVIILLLNVLRGYDEQCVKDMRLLDLADFICEWLKGYGDKIDCHILRLNQLQIIKRRRLLNIKEKIELGNFTDMSNPANVRCGAYILLEEVFEAQECFGEMSPEAQKEFLTFPICHFGELKLMEEKTNG